MTLIYTTTEAIARRLRGRLKLSTTLSPNSVPSVNAGQVVDPDLINDIGAQVEDKLNLILSQIYKMPLANSHPILAGIVERWAVAQIMNVHFQSTQIPELGGDANFGALMYKQAQEDLAMLTAGHNIQLAGIPTPATVPGAITPQPIVLPGEELADRPPDTLSMNVTVVGQTKGRSMSDFTRREWGINWDSQDRAPGSEPLWW